jgi:hypothetical protein
MIHRGSNKKSGNQYMQTTSSLSPDKYELNANINPKRNQNAIPILCKIKLHLSYLNTYTYAKDNLQKFYILRGTFKPIFQKASFAP